jgi:integrase
MSLVGPGAVERVEGSLCASPETWRVLLRLCVGLRRLLEQVASHPGSSQLGALLYGSGMRLMEGLAPQVKDVSFERRQIIVRRARDFEIG